MDTVDYAAATGVEAGAADVMGQLKDAAAEAETHRERAAVFSAIGHTPGLAESGIDADVLDELLPDAGVVGARWVQDGDPRATPFGKFLHNKRLAPVIIGTPGGGGPTKSSSHPESSSLDLQKCERRPGASLGARHHHTSFQFLSFAVFGGPKGPGTISLRLRAGSFRICRDGA